MFNQVVVSGVVTAVEPLRYTPAGIAKAKFNLRHQSQQAEAGGMRQVLCEISVFAFAEIAQRAANLSVGQTIRVSGFLAQQSYRSRQLVLHINDIILE